MKLNVFTPIIFSAWIIHVWRAGTYIDQDVVVVVDQVVENPTAALTLSPAGFAVPASKVSVLVLATVTDLARVRFPGPVA